MTEPLVCAVCLVKGRPEMVRRAVASFRAQSYYAKMLLILDTTPDGTIDGLLLEDGDLHLWHYHPRADRPCSETIGALRNKANGHALGADIIAHWDSDDWSHPNRLAEQVALLQASGASGADCVGYHQCVFWDSTSRIRCCGCKARGRSGAIKCDFCPSLQFEAVDGLAYVYTGQMPRLCAVGASLMYWRRVWERVPFDDVMVGEDSRFVAKVNTVAVSALCEPGAYPQGVKAVMGYEPRLIASIHGGNTSKFALEGKQEFRRSPELDEYCRGAMRL